MMDSNRMATLLELIAEFCHESDPWKEKRDKLLAEATESDKTNLYEFSAWFEEPTE